MGGKKRTDRKLPSPAKKAPKPRRARTTEPTGTTSDTVQTHQEQDTQPSDRKKPRLAAHQGPAFNPKRGKIWQEKTTPDNA